MPLLLPKRWLSSTASLLPRKYLPAPEADPPSTRIEDTLAFLVKVCGITTEQDAEIALEAGANAIGFNFDARNPRSIDAARARQIVQAVRGPYLKVGVFVNPTEDELLETPALIPLNVLQLHGDAAPLHLAKSLSGWRAVRVDAVPDTLSPDVAAWLLDAPAGRVFDWSSAANFSARTILAGGGLENDTVISAIQAARPWGADACAGLESKPGHKDPERIKDFVQAALAGFRLCRDTQLAT